MFDYLVYYSKSKINMLFEQLNEPKNGDLRGTIGVNLGVFKGELTAAEETQKGDLNKLKEVLDQLQNKNVIGSIQEHKDYIVGPLMMGWETDTITHWRTKIANTNTSHLYIIDLFGSKKHIIGHYKDEDSYPQSIYPSFIHFAEKYINSEEISDPLTWCYMELINEGIYDCMTTFDFVAKVMYRETLSYQYRKENSPKNSNIEPYDYTTYILATPLYVNMPYKISENIRRIDGKNYLMLADFATKIETNTINESINYLINALQSFSLLEEAEKFQRDIKLCGNEISKTLLLEIASKYFCLRDIL